MRLQSWKSCLMYLNIKMENIKIAGKGCMWLYMHAFIRIFHYCWDLRVGTRLDAFATLLGLNVWLLFINTGFMELREVVKEK